jgi:hypothetical protein
VAAKKRKRLGTERKAALTESIPFFSLFDSAGAVVERHIAAVAHQSPAQRDGLSSYLFSAANPKSMTSTEVLKLGSVRSM